MIKKLVSWARSHVGSGSSSSAEDRVLLERCRDELDRMVRISSEYFHLIESMEHQREEWKVMFFQQSGEHLEAQAMLENTIIAMRHMVQNAITSLNDYRKKNGEPPVEQLGDLMSYPIGTSKNYEASMAALKANAPKDIDGLLERAAIQSRHES